MSTPKFGDFNAKVLGISISLSSERPAIFTRLELEDATTQTHAVRLNHPDSLRIGFDELRSAFPNQLGSFNDEELLTHLIEKTDSFKALPVIVGIEAQLKNGVPVKGPQNQPYYNIRLRSGVRNLAADQARAIATRLLASAAMGKAIDDALSEAEPAEATARA